MLELADEPRSIVPNLESDLEERYLSASGEEVVLSLDPHRLFQGPASTIFTAGNIVVKYQSDCLDDTGLHPLVREFYFLTLLAPLQIAPAPMYLSGPIRDAPEMAKTGFTNGSCLLNPEATIRFLVMEKLGLSIYRFLLMREELGLGKLSVPDAVGLGAQLLRLLQELHALSIVHGDIHFGNVVFGPEGELRLIDFGLAEIAEDSADADAPPLTSLIYHQYLSPWEMEGAQASIKSDIFRAVQIVAILVCGLDWERRAYQMAISPGLLQQQLYVLKKSGNMFPLVKACPADPGRHLFRAQQLANQERPITEIIATLESAGT